MYMEDEEILKQFQNTRRLKPQTMKGYKDAVRIYTQYHDLTLEDLFLEAIHEEQSRIPWVDRTLKKRLETFRNYLYDNYAKKTAKIHFGRKKYKYYLFSFTKSVKTSLSNWVKDFSCLTAITFNSIFKSFSMWNVNVSFDI